MKTRWEITEKRNSLEQEVIVLSAEGEQRKANRIKDQIKTLTWVLSDEEV